MDSCEWAGSKKSYFLFLFGPFCCRCLRHEKDRSLEFSWQLLKSVLFFVLFFVLPFWSTTFLMLYSVGQIWIFRPKFVGQAEFPSLMYEMRALTHMKGRKTQVWSKKNKIRMNSFILMCKGPVPCWTIRPGFILGVQSQSGTHPEQCYALCEACGSIVVFFRREFRSKDLVGK